MDISSLGPSAAVVVVVVYFLKFMRDESDKRDATYAQVAIALDSLRVVTSKNMAATESADTYLRQRNGRDNEHHTAVLEALGAIPTTMQTIADTQAQAIIVAVQEGHIEQKVEHQTVTHQVIDERHDKKEERA